VTSKNDDALLESVQLLVSYKFSIQIFSQQNVSLKHQTRAHSKYLYRLYSAKTPLKLYWHTFSFILPAAPWLWGRLSP